MRSHNASAIGFAAALALGAAAHAGPMYEPGLDKTFSINSGNQFNVTNTAVAFTIDVDASPNPIVGFSFEGNWSVTATGFPEPPRFTQLTITSPDNTVYIVGGNSGFDTPWDFQAAGFQPATHSHGPDLSMPDSPAGGMWEFSFVRNAGSGIHHWSDVTITLHSIPAPGALALLGIAGVCGRRRRRLA